MNRKIILFTLSAFAASVASHAALAVGDDNSAPPKKTKTTTQCKDGKVWDAKRNRCVDAKRSDLSDDVLFDAARELAYAGQYENAIKVLGAMNEQQSARVLNYLGYSNRKAGRMELGMQYYKRAIQADENYILARSYMGQALVEQGRVEEARAQLVEIRDRGSEGTWAYQALLESLGGVRQY
ncbi:tetratricopeptide repeat protein [Sinorhizobium americanum]|uniref:Tetratricopeptide repeat protein n=1 Tax=Sinorhizobium americanum TaxID=194963 RepID=A0A4R2BXI9_9HYPH|nr:tetratricopeptide repeat protein [Sinorhizobium americanum]TCN32386.1 tetratricopeptide repeat protein [Sinorhizobium americanum]